MLDVFLPFQKKEKDKLNKIKDKSTKIKKLSDLYKINKKRASLKTKKKHILKTVLWSSRHRFTHLHLLSIHTNQNAKPHQNATTIRRGQLSVNSTNTHLNTILTHLHLLLHTYKAKRKPNTSKRTSKT